MKKRLLLFYILVIQTSLWAQQNVVFKGTVLNGSKNNTIAKNLGVSLQRIVGGNGAPNILQETQTNSAGVFSFAISNVDTNSSYVVGANYNGVTYFSETTQFKNSLLLAEKQLTVYDTTKSTANVTSFMHHLFLEDDGASIVFRETTVLSNPSLFTIVGSVHEHGIGDACLKFQLPIGAQNFTPSSGNPSVELVRSGDFVFDTGVFVPGNKQISYVYQLPWRKNSTTVFLDIPYGANSFDIFLNNPNIKISSTQLVDHGPFNIRGTQYKRLGTSNIIPGSRIEFNIQRDSKIVQDPVPIILFTTLLLLLAAFYAISQKANTKKSSAVFNRKELLSSKAEIIKSIAQLDSELSQNPNPAKQEKRNRLYEGLQSIELELSNNNPQAQSRKKK